jgi:hypothetical protein
LIDKMPRKRKPKFSEYKIPPINPGDRQTVRDQDLVRATLVDFDEVAVLPDDIRERLVEDLVTASRFARGGIKAGKRHVSDKAMGKHVFMFDVGRALERASLSATRWRKTYEGDHPDRNAPESLFFRLARALADAFGISLPKDLKLAGQRASKIKYGEMSPAMEAAQAAELVARARRRFDGLVLRLKTCAAQKGGLRLATATTSAVPVTVYAGLPLELRLLALGLSSALSGSGALAGSSFAG